MKETPPPCHHVAFITMKQEASAMRYYTNIYRLKLINLLSLKDTHILMVQYINPQ